MIRLSDRVAAMVGCFAAGAVIVGAKATAVILGIWTVVTLLSTAGNTPDASNQQRNTPSPTAIGFLIFALFSGLSALWANNPAAAIKAAALLILMLVFGHLLMAALRRLSSAGAVLVAGWFLIGLVGGSLILLEELISNFAITRMLFEAFPGLRPSTSSMVQIIEGRISLVSIPQEIGNWNVAGLNLLLWPALLLLSSLSTNGLRSAAGLGLLLLTAAITFYSEHQTSQLAIVASLAVFVLAVRWPYIMRRLTIGAFVVLFVGLVPFSQYAFQRPELQQASWAQFTLKERFRIWGNAAAHVQNAPLLGIGANNTTTVHTQALPSGNPPEPVRPHHPHSMILQIWLELGAVGVGIFLIGGLATIGDVSRMSPRAAAFGYASIAMIGLQSVATWNLWSVWFQAVVVLAWCLLALGNRITASGPADTVAFNQIWLPDRLKTL